MKKIIPLTIALLATSTLFVGTNVLAQPAPQAEFTRAAAETRAAAAFARLDVNSDGQLSPADREAQARARFDAADSDHNGQLSFAEVTTSREARGEARGERREARSERREARMAARGENGEARGERRGMRTAMRGAGPMGHMAGRMLTGADADGNGTVTQSEFTAKALERFDAADANNDGTITGEERRAMRDAHRGENGGEGRGHWRQRG